MADTPREDRIILTVGAVGRGFASDPEKLEPLKQRLRLEHALDPFRTKRKAGERKRSFDEVLEAGEDGGDGDQGGEERKPD